MSVHALESYRRERTFADVAEYAVGLGLAVASPDAAGQPQITASIRLISKCGDCGLRLPADHTCNPLEASRG